MRVIQHFPSGSLKTLDRCGEHSHFADGKTEAQSRDALFPAITQLVDRAVTSTQASRPSPLLCPAEDSSYHTANTNWKRCRGWSPGRAGELIHCTCPIHRGSRGNALIHTVLAENKSRYQALERCGASSTTGLQLEEKDPAIEHTER